MLTLVGTDVPLRPRLRSRRGFSARLDEPLDDWGAPEGRTERVRGSREHDKHATLLGWRRACVEDCTRAIAEFGDRAGSLRQRRVCEPL